jgi:hypothetical protein
MLEKFTELYSSGSKNTFVLRGAGTIKLVGALSWDLHLYFLLTKSLQAVSYHYLEVASPSRKISKGYHLFLIFIIYLNYTLTRKSWIDTEDCLVIGLDAI